MISNFNLSESGIFGIYIVNVVQGYVLSIDSNMFWVLDDKDLNCDPDKLRKLLFTSCISRFGCFRTIDEAHDFVAFLESKGLSLNEGDHLIVY